MALALSSNEAAFGTSPSGPMEDRFKSPQVLRNARMQCEGETNCSARGRAAKCLARTLRGSRAANCLTICSSIPERISSHQQKRFGGSSGPSSACDPYRETIELGLSRGRNAVAIWQDLVDQHGFAGGYQSVKRFVRKLRGVQSPEARAVILTPAGEDYGEFSVMVRSGGELNFS